MSSINTKVYSNFSLVQNFGKLLNKYVFANTNILERKVLKAVSKLIELRRKIGQVRLKISFG
jgi:hypothetical protein